MKLLILLIIALLVSVAVGQKTVRVREYQRKDGTVVRSHERRAPRSQRSPAPVIGYDPNKVESQTPLIIEYDPDKSSEPRAVTDLVELSRLVLSHPYEVVDLGHGSTYTPGGTGTIRPRRIKLPCYNPQPTGCAY